MEQGKILLVDDEESILRALKRTLIYNGYSPLVTTHPQEAIELINQGIVGILICDQRMPNMLGNELIKYTRKHYPEIVRILITGYSDMNSTITAINDGQIFRFISKPWKDEEIIQVVQEAYQYRDDLLRNKYILSTFLSEKEDWKKTINNMTLSLDNSIKGAINALLKTVEVKDIELFQHSKRVEACGMQIASKMGLSEERKVNLSNASLFHDIGKIAIRDKILYKNGPLSDSDFISMKQHPVYGKEIISELGFLDSVADIILQHHEKVNGKGYPHGLTGNEIMLEANILAIADVWDAITSDRVYHKGLEPQEAIPIMLNECGASFDPEVLGLFMKTINEPGLSSLNPNEYACRANN